MQTDLKKAIGVQILRILYNYTSKTHCVTQTAIAQYLNDMGISCTRKTVARNLTYLMQIGVPIKRIQSNSGGYYYDFDNDTFFVRKNI